MNIITKLVPPFFIFIILVLGSHAEMTGNDTFKPMDPLLELEVPVDLPFVDNSEDFPTLHPNEVDCINRSGSATLCRNNWIQQLIDENSYNAIRNLTVGILDKFEQIQDRELGIPGEDRALKQVNLIKQLLKLESRIKIRNSELTSISVAHNALISNRLVHLAYLQQFATACYTGNLNLLPVDLSKYGIPINNSDGFDVAKCFMTKNQTGIAVLTRAFNAGNPVQALGFLENLSVIKALFKREKNLAIAFTFMQVFALILVLFLGFLCGLKCKSPAVIARSRPN